LSGGQRARISRVFGRPQNRFAFYVANGNSSKPVRQERCSADN
jgi:hypothetical protein